MNALETLWIKMFEEEQRRQGEGRKTERWRPLLHIAPPFGWLNDPNGLCQQDGIYHAFYQFSPFQVEGGLKFWGHCTSRDLLHWEFQGISHFPDQPFDCHGVYSGSALAEEGKIYTFYTGNIKEQGEHDYIVTGRRSNTVLAVSADGKIFDHKELLMTGKDYPSDLTCHVRDPKVWKENGTYYMIQGARTKENRGTALVFASADKRHWSYQGRLETEEEFGYMWECPDVYLLDGRRVLCISPQGIPASGLCYQNDYQSVTCFLEDDFRGTMKSSSFRELDGGFDFYAPQSFQAEDGRRIQIAWMGMPDVEEYYINRTVADGWQHMMTIPRELTVRDGRLCQNPVQELDAWWNREETISGEFYREIASSCELDIETGGESLELVLAKGLRLSYRREEGIFWMKFEDESLGAGRTVRGRKLESLKELRILVDVSSVEVFLNGGRDVFTTRFYPEDSSYTVRAWGSLVTCRYRFRA